MRDVVGRHRNHYCNRALVYTGWPHTLMPLLNCCWEAFLVGSIEPQTRT